MESREKKAYFAFMGAYWSCLPSTLKSIEQTWEEQRIIPSLDQFPDVRELKRKPHARKIVKVEHIDPRTGAM